MKPLRTHKGKTVSLLLDNIDTDQIIPKQYLKRIERTGFGEFLFDEWRYLDDRSLNQTFPLNDEARKEATILLTGKNFGCGSSREHAPWALNDYGFQIIIAESFADIFYNNCIKNGMLPISLNEKIIKDLSTLPSDQTLKVDLEKQLIVTPIGDFEFEIDGVWKNKLLNGLDDIAITMQYENEIKEYEEVNR